MWNFWQNSLNYSASFLRFNHNNLKILLFIMPGNKHIFTKLMLDYYRTEYIHSSNQLGNKTAVLVGHIVPYSIYIF